MDIEFEKPHNTTTTIDRLEKITQHVGTHTGPQNLTGDFQRTSGLKPQA
jgi:hypothetical protein